MKFNLRETILITLLVVALLPLVGLSVYNHIELSKEEDEDRQNYLHNALSYMLHNFNHNKENLSKTLKNISLVMDEFNIDIHSTDKITLHNTLKALKETTNLDVLTLYDTNQTALSRGTTEIYGDRSLSDETFHKVMKNKIIIYTELVADKDLKNEGQELLERTKLTLIETSNPLEHEVIDTSKGIFLIGAAPLYSEINGKKTITAIILGAKLLSKDYLQINNTVKGISGVRVGLQPIGKPIIKDSNVITKPLINPKGEAVGNIVVWVDPKTDEKMLTDTQLNSIIAYAIVSLLVLIASFFVAKYLAQPLSILDKATKEIANDNLDVHVKVHGPTEIEHLSHAFNLMIKEMSEKRQMKDNFIATLTHDMRVPLLAEEKAIKLLLSDNNLPLSDDYKFLLENMSSSNEDLLRLVNTLLDTYKLESGKYRLDIYSHDIYEVLNNAVNELKPLADDRQQTLMLSCELENKVAKFDKNEIKRVFKNLLSNAIKFTKDKGEIKVKLYSEENNIIVSFTDNGKGMTEEEMSKLFVRYSSGAKKLRKVGTGLGLYLSYQIINAHNGTIKVNSELNKGSTFYVTIPREV